MVGRLAEEDRAEPRDPAAREMVARGERIAYFSAEFGLTEVLPIYAGGLGVLAGDLLKSASDLGVPLIGVGLFYREGYFRQIISEEGRQTEAYPVLEPDELPLSIAEPPDGEPAHRHASSSRAAPCTCSSAWPRSAACRSCSSTRTSPRTSRRTARSRLASTAAGARCVSSRRSCSASAACARSRQLGMRRRSVTSTRATPPSSRSRRSASSCRGGAPHVRRGARGRDERQHLHDAHAGAGRHRRVHAGAALEVLRRLRRTSSASPSTSSSTSGREVGEHGRELFSMAVLAMRLSTHQNAVSRLHAERLARALARRDARSAALGDPDQPDHQRRASADLDRARDRRARASSRRRSRWTGRSCGVAHEALRARLVASCREKLVEEKREQGAREEEIAEAAGPSTRRR